MFIFKVFRIKWLLNRIQQPWAVTVKHNTIFVEQTFRYTLSIQDVERNLGVDFQ